LPEPAASAEEAEALLDAARSAGSAGSGAPASWRPAGRGAPQAAAGALRTGPGRRAPRVRPDPSKTLIFVIDDVGYSMKELLPFLELPFPLTLAVLPELPGSAEAAAAIRASGKELMLHQPMEAIGGQDPGPGAIRLGMDAGEARRVLLSNLDTVRGAVGMNNHMGSAVTTDPLLMEVVSALAKERGIYYLDSLTIPATATAAAARREGIRYWERDVFLDNAPDRASILRAVDDGKKRASKGGPAVMIGHVWSAELAQTLMDLYPRLVEEGFSLSTISRFMLAEAEGDDESTGN